MTISATTRMTTKQKADLDKMKVDSQRAGGLGSRLDAMQYGTAPVIASTAGTLTAMTPTKYSCAPALQNATGVKAAFTLLVAAQPGITAGITSPAVPRIVTVKGNDANCAGNVVIHGTNFAGVAIIDTIALSGTAEVLGVNAFKTVTSIDYPAYAVAGTETVSIGRGIKIGFPIAIPNSGLVISKSFNGATDAGTVTPAATVEGSIYSVAGTMDGTTVVDLVFLA